MSLCDLRLSNSNPMTDVALCEQTQCISCLEVVRYQIRFSLFLLCLVVRLFFGVYLAVVSFVCQYRGHVIGRKDSSKNIVSKLRLSAKDIMVRAWTFNVCFYFVTCVPATLSKQVLSQWCLSVCLSAEKLKKLLNKN